MIYELRRDISAICAALMYVDVPIPLPYLISSMILAHGTYVQSSRNVVNYFSASDN